MITTDLTPGSPCWLDLGVRDLPAEAAFYRAVLGWEYEPMGGGEGGGVTGARVVLGGGVHARGRRAFRFVVSRADRW